MNTAELIKKIKGGNRAPFLYHFTDTRNIASIAQKGIYSRTQVNDACLPGVICGGNEWSFEQDDRRNVSDYVHLCFFDRHPMEYLAKKDERILESYFIKVVPEILDREGVIFCAGVSNAADSTFFDVEKIEQHMDLEILFKRTDWRLPEIQERLKLAQKYEILIPKWVPKSYLRR